MPIEDFIIIIYVCIDDFLKETGTKVRNRGPSPKLTDAEVLTMEFVGEFLSLGSDKAIFEYFKRHWLEWFPNLGCRTTFTKQASNLCSIKEQLWRFLLSKMEASDLYLFDGFPIPTCNIKPGHLHRLILDRLYINILYKFVCCYDFLSYVF